MSLISREQTVANRKRILDSLNVTGEELELFERLWEDYWTNYSETKVWTAPELEHNESLRRRWWSWSGAAKAGPLSDAADDADAAEAAEEERLRADQSSGGSAKEDDS